MDRVYIVAARNDSSPPDWLEQLRSISGVQVRGGTRNQTRILADEQAIAQVRAKLSRHFLIEEEVGRSF